MENNPLDLDPIMLRWISNVRGEKRDYSIFKDRENVHDSHIISTAKKSVDNLINLEIYDCGVIQKIINDPDLSPECIQKLIEYAAQKCVHSALSVTFLDVLSMIYPLILQLPDPFEAKKILANEMEAAECKCFTGKIIRLINVLNGLHPAVCVQISDSSDLSNIFLHLKDKYGDLPNDELKDLIIRELLERGHSMEKISEWTDYL